MVCYMIAYGETISMSWGVLPNSSPYLEISKSLRYSVIGEGGTSEQDFKVFLSCCEYSTDGNTERTVEPIGQSWEMNHEWS